MNENCSVNKMLLWNWVRKYKSDSVKVGDKVKDVKSMLLN